MTTQYITSVHCPICGTEFEYPIHLSVIEQQEPELAAKLLNGDFFHAVCPGCSKVMGIEYKLLYSDMDKLVMIYFLPDEEDEQSAIPQFEQAQQKLKEANVPNWENASFRIVSTSKELIEKVRIFHEGLDDRVVELFKIVIRNHLKESGMNVKEIDYDYMPNNEETAEEEGSLGYVSLIRGKEPFLGYTLLDLDYNALREDMETTMARTKADMKSYYVDLLWASTMFDRMQKTLRNSSNNNYK